MTKAEIVRKAFEDLNDGDCAVWTSDKSKACVEHGAVREFINQGRTEEFMFDDGSGFLVFRSGAYEIS